MNTKCNISAFIIISISGTLLHFAYAISGENLIVGIFSSVNESIWEHQKLLFYPSLLYFTIEFFICGKRYRNYLAAVFIGITAGIFTIITAFYTYSGILGYSITFIDILLFFIGTAIMIIIKNLVIKNGVLSSPLVGFISTTVLLVTAILFGIWTYNPPKIAIFIPDISQTR